MNFKKDTKQLQFIIGSEEFEQSSEQPGNVRKIIIKHFSFSISFSSCLTPVSFSRQFFYEIKLYRIILGNKKFVHSVKNISYSTDWPTSHSHGSVLRLFKWFS